LLRPNIRRTHREVEGDRYRCFLCNPAFLPTLHVLLRKPTGLIEGSYVSQEAQASRVCRISWKAAKIRYAARYLRLTYLFTREDVPSYTLTSRMIHIDQVSKSEFVRSVSSHSVLDICSTATYRMPPRLRCLNTALRHVPQDLSTMNAYLGGSDIWRLQPLQKLAIWCLYRESVARGDLSRSQVRVMEVCLALKEIDVEVSNTSVCVFTIRSKGRLLPPYFLSRAHTSPSLLHSQH
jgi:hypothetical protein